MNRRPLIALAAGIAAISTFACTRAALPYSDDESNEDAGKTGATKGATPANSQEDGATCSSGTTRACYDGDASVAGIGQCAMGTQTCSGGEFGHWGGCVGSVAPAAETCDGIDNDCNGQIDDGLTRACATACGNGAQTCAAGTWGDCTAPSDCSTEPANRDAGTTSTPTESTSPVCRHVAVNQTAWMSHAGPGPLCFPTTFSVHGDPGEYAFAPAIPDASDPGWQNVAAPNISFSQHSRMCDSICNCMGGGDFDYWETFIQVPDGAALTSVVVTIANVDDGVRVSVFNSANPAGVTPPGSFAELGGGSVTDLAPFFVPGLNRIVLTHVDDCCSDDQIANATIAVNGGSLPLCTDGD